MKRFLVKWAPVLIVLSQTLLSFSGLPIGWKTFTAVFLVTLFTINHVLSVSRPFERFERFEATKRDILEQLTRPMREQYQESGVEVRMSAMIARRKFFVRKEPKARDPKQLRTQLFARCLFIKWRSENMRQDADRNLVFTTRQGVCGEAFQSGSPAWADFTDYDPVSYSLNAEQTEKTASLRFVYSFPIRRMNPETERLSDDVIGVVNIDSRTNGAEQFIKNQVAREALREKAKEFAHLCSKLF